MRPRVYGPRTAVHSLTDWSINLLRGREMTTIEEAMSTQTGISFALSDEQRGAPPAGARVRREGDPAEGGGVRRAVDPPGRHRREVSERLMNPHIPEAYGGLGLPSFDGMLIGEEACAWGCSGMSPSRSSRTRSGPRR